MPNGTSVRAGQPWAQVLLQGSRRESSSDDSPKPAGGSSAAGRGTREERVERARAMAHRGRNKLAELWRRYGFIAVGTYFTIYVTTLGGAFAVFHTGLIPPEEIIGDPKVAIEKLTRFIRSNDSLLFAEPYLHFLHDTPAATNLALGWIATKLTEPLRALVTVAITPRLARLAGRVPADDKGRGTGSAAAAGGSKD